MNTAARNKANEVHSVKAPKRAVEGGLGEEWFISMQRGVQLSSSQDFIKTETTKTLSVTDCI